MNHERMPAKMRVRCSRCNSVELTLTEHIECFSAFEQHADGTIDVEGQHSEGGYFRVTAKCECGHSWTVRGAKQITDVRDDRRP